MHAISMLSALAGHCSALLPCPVQLLRQLLLLLPSAAATAAAAACAAVTSYIR